MTSLDPVGVSAAAKALNRTMDIKAVERAESCVAAYLAVAGSPADERASTPNEEFIEAAWGLIANAYGGNWSDAPDEWHGAACRWRDEYVAGATARIPAASPADERLREARDRWRERARDLEAQLHRANDELVQIADYSPSEVADAIDSTRAAIKDALAPAAHRGGPITEEEWAEGQPQVPTAFPVAPPATCESCGDESVVRPGECCTACRRAHERLEPAAPVFDQGRLVDAVAFVNWHAEGPCGCDGDPDDPCNSCRALALLASWDAAGVSAEAAPDDFYPGPRGAEKVTISDSEFIEPPVMPNMSAQESGGDKPGITPPPNPYPENWKATGVTSPHEAWEECCAAWLAARDTNEPKENAND